MATKKKESNNGIDLASAVNAVSSLGGIDIKAEAEKVVKKLTGDESLLEKFKKNAMKVVSSILPAIKDKNILQAIVDLVKSKLNLSGLLGGVGSLLTGTEKEETATTSTGKKKKKKKNEKKDEKKEDGGILSAIGNLLTGK